MNSMISHHAVLFCSEQPLVCSLEAQFDTPAMYQYRIPQFGIDNVRALITDAYRRPDDTTDRKILLVATEFVTEEAQQALLKIIEEPPTSTAFVFVIPHGYTFLPTLESRFERMGSLDDVSEYEVFEAFAADTVRDRLAAIEQALKQKDVIWQQAIKKGLVSYIKKEIAHLPKETLDELEYVSRLLLTRGASNKFLLEHLALVLPS